MNVWELGVYCFYIVDHCGDDEQAMQLMMLTELDLVNALLTANFDAPKCSDSTAFFTPSIAAFSTRTSHDVMVAVLVALCVVLVCLI